MTLILAVIPVLLLIILMAFFKMSGDKSSIISKNAISIINSNTGITARLFSALLSR